LIKSVGKSEHGCCDHKTSRNIITCCAEMSEIFVWGGRGAGCLQMGRVGIRKKKGEIREERVGREGIY
jgi:hypothetical protein